MQNKAMPSSPVHKDLLKMAREFWKEKRGTHRRQRDQKGRVAQRTAREETSKESVISNI